MRILLLAYAFPPHNVSGAVRVGKFAEHLFARGHDVRVIAAASLPYPRTLASAFPAERVVATRWHNLAAPIDAVRERAKSALPADAASPDAAGKPTWPMRLVQLYRAGICVPDAQIGWVPYATTAARKWSREWRPELIYSSALPFSSHVAAALIARRTGCPWVAEFRDLFADNPYSDRPHWRIRLDRTIERRVVASAAACVTVSPPLAEELAVMHGKPVASILNGYEPADLAKASRTLFDDDLGLDSRKVTILYTGIIYPGRRDPSPLFEALRLLGEERRNVEVRFHGPPDRMIGMLARRHGVEQQVRVLPAVPHARALALQQTTDILLLLLWNDPRENGVFTGKVFEYAGSGRPILTLGCADGVAAELVRGRRLGIVANEPAEIARQLRLWIDEKARSDRIDRDPAAGGTEDLTREHQFLQLDRFLARHGLLE
jgi:glycosyltransferase involved in cell wall biosynthesis